MVKLAFWKTIGDAYRFVFSRPLVSLRVGWFPLLVSLAVWFAQNPKWNSTPIGKTAVGILQLSLLAIGISWAIAYTRSVLLSETSWLSVFQFRRRHGRLVWLILLGSLIYILPFFTLYILFAKILPALGQLALQLHFPHALAVAEPRFGLMGAPPQRPSDDVSGLDAPLCELASDASDFLNGPADQERLIVRRRGGVFLGGMALA